MSVKYSLLPLQCDNRVVFSFKATAQSLRSLRQGNASILFSSHDNAVISTGNDAFNGILSECNEMVHFFCYC